jgi:hypothetical protein
MCWSILSFRADFFVQRFIFHHGVRPGESLISEMRAFRQSLLVVLCFTFFSIYLFASAKQPPALQPDYASALAAADRFLQAWQSGDAENGMALLTTRAKREATEESIEKFFSGGTASAYEIGHGKLLKRGRYEFPVVLIRSVDKHLRRQFTSIMVVNTGGKDWVVDKLP